MLVLHRRSAIHISKHSMVKYGELQEMSLIEVVLFPLLFPPSQTVITTSPTEFTAGTSLAAHFCSHFQSL